MSEPVSLTLDTSVIVRLLTQEPADQFQLAAQFTEEQITAGVAIFISDLVLAEAYYALQSFYHFSKSDALTAIAALAQTSGLWVSPAALAVLPVPNLATAKPGFVDRLIHSCSLTAGHSLVTFEKSAKKLPATVVLESSL